jgi:ELWxxDGT repeat protein
VKDVNPLPDSNGGKVSDLVMVGTTLYFAAADANGTELWKSDGTAVGTVQVKDIFARPAHTKTV